LAAFVKFLYGTSALEGDKMPSLYM